jgi:hypothetical protein
MANVVMRLQGVDFRPGNLFATSSKMPAMGSMWPRCIFCGTDLKFRGELIGPISHPWPPRQWLSHGTLPYLLSPNGRNRILAPQHVMLENCQLQLPTGS